MVDSKPKEPIFWLPGGTSSRLESGPDCWIIRIMRVTIELPEEVAVALGYRFTGASKCRA